MGGLLLIGSGCSRRPKGVLSDKVMRKVIVDLQIAENIVNTDPNFYDLTQRQALYHAVFQKHGTSQQQYDSSLIWYGKHLEQFMQIYNLAIADVKQQIDDLGDVTPDTPIGNKDSVNVWMLSDYHEFNHKKHDDLLTFHFQPAESFSYGSIFILGFQIFNPSPMLHLTLEVKLQAQQGDSAVYVNETIAGNGYHEVMIRTMATRRVQKVYGYVRVDGGKEDWVKIYVDDFKLVKYNYGSQAVARKDSVTK
jgi:hypothetical protein